MHSGYYAHLIFVKRNKVVVVISSTEYFVLSFVSNRFCSVIFFVRCLLKFAALKYLPTSSLEPSAFRKAVRRHTTQRGGSLTTHHTSGKKFGSLDHCAILWINKNEKLRNVM